MRRMTLLEIVQDILNDQDGDEVDSITETLESQQVANIVRSVYEHIIDGRDWPHLYELFQLTSSADADFPTYLTIPDDIEELQWFKYNKKQNVGDADKFEAVNYKPPKDFIEYCNQRNSTSDTVDTITDPSGVTIYVLNNSAPMFYTSFDNDTIICDAYDSDVDDTLQTSKTQCYGKRLPVFDLVDSYIPDLPTQAFALLVNEAKSAASLKLRQMPDQKAEQYAITGRRRMSQESWKVNNGITYPDYGRKGKK
jgi:hypothetical protein